MVCALQRKQKENKQNNFEKIGLVNHFRTFLRSSRVDWQAHSQTVGQGVPTLILLYH